MADNNSLLADRLVRAAVILTRWLRAADPAPKLSGSQASALAIIVHCDGITPSALAVLEEVKRPTIARTVAELQAMELISRRPDPADGRSVLLVASAKGRKLFQAGQQRRLQPLVAAFQSTSAADRRRVEEALQVLESLLQREATR